MGEAILFGALGLCLGVWIGLALAERWYQRQMRALAEEVLASRAHVRLIRKWAGVAHAE